MEIERKFLVKPSLPLDQATGSTPIIQGYLTKSNGLTIRIRIKGNKAYLTIKSPSDEQGISREEWEYEIPKEDAEKMLPYCSGRLIYKRRYYFMEPSGLRWEVDVFEKELKGLIIAEIELPQIDTPFTLPDWIEKEVTGIPDYYNSHLASMTAR